ncbi:alpha/beta fold hydrolase [Streptomyces sp. G45]|uniref:alpha/beta fold hydrolase n=1 Tax=Streptomyces sp. G45 TaxID=3406627 RepID=UPI003C1B04F9
MPVIAVNGIRLHYEEAGSGDPVVLIQGTGGGHSAWDLHQVPDLTAAGYRVITFDNRGIAPSSECADGFTIDDLVGDVAGLITRLGLGPCRVVGTSMGAFVAQELALTRPELVTQAVFMATRGRTDALRRAMTLAEIELYDSGVQLPAKYAAAMRALKSLSPAPSTTRRSSSTGSTCSNCPHRPARASAPSTRSANWTTASPPTAASRSPATSSPSPTTSSPRPTCPARSPTPSPTRPSNSSRTAATTATWRTRRR